MLRERDVIILALGALPRLFIAYTDHGMIWGDEIYQSLEPAHRRRSVMESPSGNSAMARVPGFPGLLAGV